MAEAFSGYAGPILSPTQNVGQAVEEERAFPVTPSTGESLSPYVGPVTAGVLQLGIATEEEVALSVTPAFPAAPGMIFTAWVGAVSAQTLGIAVEEDVALQVVPLAGPPPNTRISNPAVYVCGTDITVAYTPGIPPIGPRVVPVGLAVDEEVALPLGRPIVQATLPFPSIALEVAFGIDPGQYAFTYSVVARSLLPFQYLRWQETGPSFPDSSRRLSNATGHGGITAQQPSPISDPAAKSITLNGTTGYLDATLNQMTDSNAITLIAWIKNAGTGAQTVLGFPACSIGFDSTSAYFGLTTDVTSFTDFFGFLAPVDGAFHLYTLTLYPENTLDAYATLDGQFIDDCQQRYGDPLAVPPVDPPPPTFANIDFSSGLVTWGRDQAAATHFFHGSLAEGMVVAGAVPLDAIRTLWEARVSGAAPQTDPSTWQWTDLTSRLVEGQTQMGRNSELDRIETAQGTFTLDNNDRALEPEYASSPYSPNVVPMRPIRARAAYKSTGYQPLYFGYVADWGVKRPSYIRGAVDVTAVDAGEAFMQDQISVWLPQQLSGARIHDLLDAAGYPPQLRNIAPGTLLLAVTNYNDQPTTPIDALNQAAESEGGYFFFDKDGTATFHDQDTRSNAPYNAPMATFGDGDGELPYLNPTPDYGIHQVKNIITVTRPNPDPTVADLAQLIVELRDADSFTALQANLPGQQGTDGTEEIAIDTTSLRKYRHRDLTIDTQLASGADALGRAEAALLRYKDPSLRFVSLDVEPRRIPDDMFPVVLTLDIANQIVVVARPAGGGLALIKASYIEAIQHQFASGDDRTWTTSYSLSPVLNAPGSGINYWVLGSSVLGYDTRLGL